MDQQKILEMMVGQQFILQGKPYRIVTAQANGAFTRLDIELVPTGDNPYCLLCGKPLDETA